MRTHGWGGQPPASDDEAIERILAATRQSIDRRGASTSITDVADTLHVTRQTVYRYFASTEDLLQATALQAAALHASTLQSAAGHAVALKAGQRAAGLCARLAQLRRDVAR